jgi:hypothetical protein
LIICLEGELLANSFGFGLLLRSEEEGKRSLINICFEVILGWSSCGIAKMFSCFGFFDDSGRNLSQMLAIKIQTFCVNSIYQEALPENQFAPEPKSQLIDQLTPTFITHFSFFVFPLLQIVENPRIPTPASSRNGQRRINLPS